MVKWVFPFLTLDLGLLVLLMETIGWELKVYFYNLQFAVLLNKCIFVLTILPAAAMGTWRGSEIRGTGVLQSLYGALAVIIDVWLWVYFYN